MSGASCRVVASEVLEQLNDPRAGLVVVALFLAFLGGWMMPRR